MALFQSKWFYRLDTGLCERSSRPACCAVVIIAYALSAAYGIGAAVSEEPFRNRLDAETSPYLRLHRDNPVHWHGWSPEAFDEARRLNKPIFLSIGYSACHWCHVMNRESFADAKIAAFLNEHFVCIKVDREERPDVDQVYLEAVQALTGRGGWPLSAFLLPDGRPFFGGTYFPPGPFRELLGKVAAAFRDRRSELDQHADAVCGFLRRAAAAPHLASKPLDSGMTLQAAREIQKRLDAEHGGVAAPPHYAPKFPQPTIGLFLLAVAQASDDRTLLESAAFQATRMARGGIFDQIGGGFHRYSVDRQWVVPHFEKMLYDQAQLVSLYSRLHALAPNAEHPIVVAETIAFLAKELTSPEGLFYSALDADSEHEEGKFYVWTQAELRAALAEDADWTLELLGALGPTNFEERYVLVRSKTAAESAKQLGVDLQQWQRRWDQARTRVESARSRRVRPLLDTKVLSSWNGLMIVGLCDAAQAFGRREYADRARRAMDALLKHLVAPDGRLHRQWIAGKGRGTGFADDYAACVLALLAVHRHFPEPRYVASAESLMAVLIRDFWDMAGKGVFYTGKEHESLVLRLKESYDGATPSANGLTALALVELAAATGKLEYRKRADELFQAFAGHMSQQPAGATTMLRAFVQHGRFGPNQIVASDRTPHGGPPATSAAKSPARPNAPTPIRRIEVEPERLKIAAAKTSTLRIRITLADGWHINANPASPVYLSPTVVRLDKQPAVSLVGVRYPKPRFAQLGGVDEPIGVYDGVVVIEVDVRADSKVEPPKEITLHIDYQACDDSRCLAPTRTSIRVPVQPQ